MRLNASVPLNGIYLQAVCENCAAGEVVSYTWRLEAAVPGNTMRRFDISDLRLDDGTSNSLVLDVSMFNIDAQEEYVLTLIGNDAVCLIVVML